MKNFIYQPFHLVTISPWPMIISFNLWLLTLSMTKMFNFNSKLSIYLMLIILMMISFQWWRDIIRESTFQGFHSKKVIMGLKIGMILFIISEVLFFISFFWTYFHMMLSPNIEIGSMWPSKGMINMLINPYSLPMINTLILVSSSMFLSYSHHLLMKKKIKKSLNWNLFTIIFGIIFIFIQIKEYSTLMFTINMSSFGSTFFMMTGFHGLHIFIGTIFLMISITRMKLNHYSNLHHFCFEASAWYWHFVDIIWLFLFLFIYWWSY